MSQTQVLTIGTMLAGVFAPEVVLPVVLVGLCYQNREAIQKAAFDSLVLPLSILMKKEERTVRRPIKIISLDQASKLRGKPPIPTRDDSGPAFRPKRPITPPSAVRR